MPRRIAAGVVIVPTAGVESMSFKSVDTRYARELGPVERTVGVHHETRVDGVTPIGGHPPASRLLLPLGFLYLGLEQGVVV